MEAEQEKNTVRCSKAQKRQQQNQLQCLLPIIITPKRVSMCRHIFPNLFFFKAVKNFCFSLQSPNTAMKIGLELSRLLLWFYLFVNHYFFENIVFLNPRKQYAVQIKVSYIYVEIHFQLFACFHKVFTATCKNYLETCCLP